MLAEAPAQEGHTALPSNQDTKPASSSNSNSIATNKIGSLSGTTNKCKRTLAADEDDNDELEDVPERGSGPLRHWKEKKASPPRRATTHAADAMKSPGA